MLPNKRLAQRLAKFVNDDSKLSQICTLIEALPIDLL